MNYVRLIAFITFQMVSDIWSRSLSPNLSQRYYFLSQNDAFLSWIYVHFHDASLGFFSMYVGNPIKTVDVSSHKQYQHIMVLRDLDELKAHKASRYCLSRH